MADFIFPCPHCKQAVQCDDAWSGHQIQCPLCHKQMVVPANQPAPAPQREVAHLGKQLVAPPSENKLKAGATQVARSASGTGAAQRGFVKPPKKKRNWGNILTGAGAVVVIAAVGWYFGLPYIKGEDDGAAPAPQPAKKAAVDAPAAPSETAAVDGPTADAGNQGQEAAATPAPAPPPPSTAIIPPMHTMMMSKAKIPDGKVNGTVTGGKFVMEAARLDRLPTGYALTLRQGTGATPDRGISVYLKMNPAETPTNKNWAITEDVKGTVVRKYWKSDPRYAAQTRDYSGGYLMKLDLGAMNESGQISGKIFLALPDTEKSVIGGHFTAATALAAAATTTYEQVPVQQSAADAAAEAAQRAAFQRRYGTQPAGGGARR